ncbi:MAG: glycosyltransferase [Chloroflexi bacterium]|nr:MAG: glycosyltransferase [Chloroflexota bacterium]
MRIAHFSPLPPQKSGIAAYCAELLPYLMAEAEVDVFVPDGSTAVSQLPFPVHPISSFWQHAPHQHPWDICLYHMGNHPAYHDQIYTTLLRYPGIVILHDLNLHAFYLHWRENGRFPHTAYLREMAYVGGLKALQTARQVIHGHLSPPTNQYPLFHRITRSSLGLIVHTRHAQKQILATQPTVNIAHIPLGVRPSSLAKPASKPPILQQVPPDAPLLLSAGYIAPSKRIEVILQALHQLKQEGQPFYYLLLGKPVPDYNIEAQIHDLGLADRICLTGYVDDQTFQACLWHADLAINLRSRPTNGEMSAALLRLMAHGKPVLVSDIDGFAEFPNGVVAKIPQETAEEEQQILVQTLRDLLTQPHKREQIGTAARQYVATYHQFEDVAQQYVTFARQCLQKLTKVNAYG